MPSRRLGAAEALAALLTAAEALGRPHAAMAVALDVVVLAERLAADALAGLAAAAEAFAAPSAAEAVALDVVVLAERLAADALAALRAAAEAFRSHLVALAWCQSSRCRLVGAQALHAS